MTFYSEEKVAKRLQRGLEGSEIGATQKVIGQVEARIIDKGY